MKLKQRKPPLPVGLSVLLALLLMLIAPSTALAGEVENPSETLSFVETLARDVRQDTATLKTYVRFPMLYSHQSHSRTLTMIRSNINEMGEQVQKLHTNRDELKNWQAELVTRILPKLQNLTADTESAIQFINTTPTADFRPLYESYVEDMYDSSNGIVRSVDSFLDWADEVAEQNVRSE